MKVKFFCPRWGSESLSWDDFMAKVKSAGYNGVEAVVWPEEKIEVMALLKKYNLEFIGQYAEPLPNAIDTCCDRYEDYLRHIVSMNPLKVDAQTGKDFFTFEQISKLIFIAKKIEKESGIKILHELHRGRFTYGTASTAPYFNHFKDLQITADFSHWCCSSESFLQDQEAIVNEAILRTEHIHARVGYPEGPQISDPRVTEWQFALNYHLDWWDKVIECHKKRGSAEMTITPEWGPYPYMVHLPNSNKPISDQWEINVWMKNLLNLRYNK